MRLREGTGGDFRNMIVTHANQESVKNNDCGNEVRTQDPAHTATHPEFLYFSKTSNILQNQAKTMSQSQFATACSWTGTDSTTPAARNVDPRFRLMPTAVDESVRMIDPRPEITGPAYSSVEEPYDTTVSSTFVCECVSYSTMWC